MYKRVHRQSIDVESVASAAAAVAQERCVSGDAPDVGVAKTDASS